MSFEIIKFIFFLFLISLIFSIFKKKKLFLNNTGEHHQSYVLKEEIPLYGGICLFLFLIYNLIFYDFNKLLIYFLILFFFLGLLGDIKINLKASTRFYLQFLFSILLFFYLDNYIMDLRVEIFNQILSYKFFAILFSAFCLTILLNGTNFIDGNNTTVLGYYLIILINIKLIDNSFLDFDNFFIFFLTILLILYLLNFYQKIMLGDSGSYVLAFFCGYMLINHYNNNVINFSPYYIATLLWYPAFENLFSIIRKLILNKSPMVADTNHLHHLLFNFIKNKFNLPCKIINSITGNSINIFNLIILSISSKFYDNTFYQIYIILVNILVYISLYAVLLKFKRDQ